MGPQRAHFAAQLPEVPREQPRRRRQPTRQPPQRPSSLAAQATVAQRRELLGKRKEPRLHAERPRLLQQGALGASQQVQRERGLEPAQAREQVEQRALGSAWHSHGIEEKDAQGPETESDRPRAVNPAASG